MKPTLQPRAQERGSALLIVFVFAAIIAIALYREMPVAAFEARRQKEQTLIDRGHEYQRAVQLYYRKFQGRYPASFETLENSNNMRFLRRRYTDPFTGKDDWRLLHAGPAGQLMDSKVANSNINGVFGQSGSNLTANSNATQLGTGFSGTSTSDSDVTVQPVAKRAPVISAASGAAESTPTSNQLDQDPSTPLLPPQDPSGPATPAASAAPNAQPNQPNSMQMVQNMFGSGANQAQPQTTAAAALNGVSNIGSTGNMSSGALAGVASKAKGKSIKKVNDQTDYSL